MVTRQKFLGVKGLNGCREHVKAGDHNGVAWQIFLDLVKRAIKKRTRRNRVRYTIRAHQVA